MCQNIRHEQSEEVNKKHIYMILLKCLKFGGDGLEGSVRLGKGKQNRSNQTEIFKHRLRKRRSLFGL